MRFSIIIPTRKRIGYLTKLIESINLTSKNKNQVELLIIYDNDDDTTMQFVNNFHSSYPVSINFYRRSRSLNINGDYHNWAAQNFAKGEYFIMCNDDTEFMQFNWDEYAWDKLEETKKVWTDGILLGITDDMELIHNRHDGNRFSCFPLFSRRDLEVLGFCFQPEYWRDGADWVIGSVYRRIGRMLDLRSEIVIKHISIRSFRREKDALHDEYTSLQHMSPEPPQYDVVTRDSKILKHYIEQGEILKPDQVEYATTGWRFIQAEG